MRIASFNTENLFSRAKILNLDSTEATDELLLKVAELQRELKREIYNKQKIFSLYNQLKDFITISEERGKLFKRAGFAIIGVQANGKGEWSGTIEFKREKFTETTRKNTAKVFKEIKADIFCIVEVEDRNVLSDFNSELLGTAKLPFSISLEGNDQRGIDLGLLTRFPIKRMRTNIFMKEKPTSQSFIFSRDCLEIELEIKNNVHLYFLCNHFKSKLNNDSTADERRKLQADTVREILKQFYDLEHEMVVVAGDFNDSPDSAAMKKLLATPNLFDVLKLQFGNNMDERWTYFFNKRNQIDYILVSKPLKNIFQKAGVERRGMAEIATLSGGTILPFPGITHPSNAASDHGAVWADFNL